MSFQAEILLARLRARGSKLVVPTLMLGVGAFAFGFFSPKATESWQAILLAVVCGAFALLGFAVPVIRYLTSWTDITTSRLITRSGLFGQRFREVSLTEVQRVELGGGRAIIVHLLNQDPITLRSLPKPKLVAQELSNLTANVSLGAK